jgi:hypothetical protein
MVWDQRAASSNLATPTKQKPVRRMRQALFFNDALTACFQVPLLIP